jgi:hypothetical protein
MENTIFFDIDGNRTEAEKKYNIELLSIKALFKRLQMILILE